MFTLIQSVEKEIGPADDGGGSLSTLRGNNVKSLHSYARSFERLQHFSVSYPRAASAMYLPAELARPPSARSRLLGLGMHISDEGGGQQKFGLAITGRSLYNHAYMQLVTYTRFGPYEHAVYLHCAIVYSTYEANDT